MSLAQAMATTFGTYCVADFLSNFLQVCFFFYSLDYSTFRSHASQLKQHISQNKTEQNKTEQR